MSRMLLLGAAIVVAVPLLDGAPPVAAPAEAVNGAMVVQRHVNAVGGREAIDAISSFHVRGIYEIPALKLKGTIELHYTRPDRLLFVVDLPGYGRIAQGQADGVGWSIDPQRGARVHGAEELSGSRAWVVRGFSLLPGSADIEAGEAVENVEFDGRPCRKVTMGIKGTSIEYTEYFDSGTGLFAGRVERRPGADGADLEVYGTASDYRRFGELLIPTRWYHKAGGQEWSAVYEQFVANEVDPAVFELPEEIRAQLEAAGAPQAGQ